MTVESIKKFWSDNKDEIKGLICIAICSGVPVLVCGGIYKKAYMHGYKNGVTDASDHISDDLATLLGYDQYQSLYKNYVRMIKARKR